MASNSWKYFFFNQSELRNSVLFVITFCSLCLFIDFNSIEKSKVLGSIIAICAIFFAVIITFFFSKVYSDRAIILEKQKVIDSAQ